MEKSIMKFYKGDQFIELIDLDTEKFLKSSAWKYNNKLNTLNCNNYEIDILKIDNSKDRQTEIFFWMFLILAERWASEKVIADLLRMFEVLFNIYDLNCSKLKLKEYRKSVFGE